MKIEDRRSFYRRWTVRYHERRGVVVFLAGGLLSGLSFSRSRAGTRRTTKMHL